MTTKTNNRMIDNGVINVKDFGAVCDGVTDDSAALQAVSDYIATLPLIKQTGTGNDAGGLIIEGAGKIATSKTWSFEGTRNLTLKDFYLVPHSTFDRGNYLLSLTSGSIIDQYAHENTTLDNITIDGQWEANGILLQDFLRVKVVNCDLHRYYFYGLRTQNINNGSHELLCDNTCLFQKFFGETFPAHVTDGISVENGSADNHYTNVVFGPSAGLAFLATPFVDAVNAGGSACFIDNFHSYSERAWSIQAPHVYISNGYFDGDYIVGFSRALSVTNCFFQYAGATGNFDFLRYAGTPSQELGEWTVTGNKFRNRDAAPNVRIFQPLTSWTTYETFFQNNAVDNVIRTVVEPAETRSVTYTSGDWTQRFGNWHLELVSPQWSVYNTQFTAEAGETDVTKFFTFTRDGNTVRVYSWFINGVGTAQPSGDVVITASNQLPPSAVGPQ